MNIFSLLEELRNLEYEHFVNEKNNIAMGEVPEPAQVYIGNEPVKFVGYDPIKKRIVLQ